MTVPVAEPDYKRARIEETVQSPAIFDAYDLLGNFAVPGSPSQDEAGRAIANLNLQLTDDDDDADEAPRARRTVNQLASENPLWRLPSTSGEGKPLALPETWLVQIPVTCLRMFQGGRSWRSAMNSVYSSIAVNGKYKGGTNTKPVDKV